jgi:Ser/Thr protein kinase RdoA (MazF antagonist)
MCLIPSIALKIDDFIDTIAYMDPRLLSAACNLYSTSPDLLIPLSGGHYNSVYQFPRGEESAILRIGVEDCPREQTLGMLEWVKFLKDEGAPVTAPVPSINNRLLENLKHYGAVYTVTAFEKAKGTLAENISPSEWTDELFRSIGMAAGKLHATSKRYRPSRPSLIRPQWFDSYEIHEATDLLAVSPDPARKILALLINELRQLPSSPIDFGLIHDDLHYANFLIHPGGSVTIIDFDDCVYGWFAMDVAMALFDVLVLYNAPNEKENQRFAQCFINNYLSGYRQENDLSLFWQSKLPRFLKLKELCIYATLIGHSDVGLPDSWVGRFMRGRSDRITNDLPYIDIDFTTL